MHASTPPFKAPRAPMLRNCPPRRMFFGKLLQANRLDISDTHVNLKRNSSFILRLYVHTCAISIIFILPTCHGVIGVFYWWEKTHQVRDLQRRVDSLRHAFEKAGSHWKRGMRTYDFMEETSQTTTWDVYNLVNNGIFTISTGAIFFSHQLPRDCILARYFSICSKNFNDTNSILQRVLFFSRFASQTAMDSRVPIAG